jgi:hypothetical protein
MLIERQGYSARFVALDGDQCTHCGEKIEMVRHVS